MKACGHTRHRCLRAKTAMQCRDCERALHAARYILILQLLSWCTMAGHSTALALKPNNEHLIQFQQEFPLRSDTLTMGKYGDKTLTFRHGGHDLANKHPSLRMTSSCCSGTVCHMLSNGSCHQLSDCVAPPAACSTHSAAVKPGFGRSRQNRQRPCCSGSAANVKLMLPTASPCS